MIDVEFDDLYYVDEAGFDDTIINDDSFAEAFGTPDMYRPDTSRRYTDKELDSMTLNERLKERLRCSKEKNVLGQRDIFTYEFKKYGVSASDTILPTISFLYAKTNALHELEKLLKENSYILFDLDPDKLPISEFFIQIGAKYPNLDEDELRQLEEFYNDTKFCTIIDELLYDKEKLPRTIKGITRHKIKDKNESFPNSLLDLVYNAFELNSLVDEDCEDTVWAVYNRRKNTIIRKAYKQIGIGECVASGRINTYVFFNLIEEKYGEECLNYFIKRVMELHSYYKNTNSSDFRKLKNVRVSYGYLFRYARVKSESEKNLQDIRHIIALAFLLEMNNISN